MNIKIALSFIFIVSRLYAQTNLLSFPAGIADELDILAKHDYEKYGILFSDPICPLGWSRDGKIAYIDGRYSSSVPSTSYKLIIQDLVTDKTVFSTEWISDYENPAFDKNEVKSIKNEEYEPGSYINFYMAYKQLIDSKLDDFNITKSSQFKAYGFPIEHNGKFYNPKVVITQKDDSDDFHQIFHFAVEILSSDNLKKTKNFIS